MAVILVKDGAGADKYIEVDGNGTSGAPFRLKGTHADEVLAVLQAIQTLAAAPVLIDAANQAQVPMAVKSITLAATLYSGQTVVPTAGTPVALATAQALLSGVKVKAKSTNAGLIYVGGAGNPQFILAAGEGEFIEISNLSTVYINATVNGDGVSYLGS